MKALIAPVQKESFWLQAEPNWPVLASEWSDDYEFNAYVCIYCDLETKSTFAVSVGNGLQTLLSDSIVWQQELDTSSWCGYEWSNTGECFTLAYGPEADFEWWSIDDILFGAFNFSYLSAVSDTTHCVISVPEIVDYFSKASYLVNNVNCKATIEYWWHELSPSEEVQYGLTQAELNEEIEAAQELLSRL